MSRTAAADLLGWATDLTLEAGRFTQRHFRSADLAVEFKGDGTPVTLADQGAEKLMRDAITEAFPNDAIVGEEYGESAATSGAASGREWIIDPIDGTKSFTAGVPLYANLLAVVDDGVPVLGIINLPATTELVAAVVGGGAHCNGEPCRVSHRRELAGSYAMTSGIGPWPVGALEELRSRDVIVRTWGDAYGYALVATGRVEAMIDPIVSKWDVAPIGVILTEAGGRYTDLRGVESIETGSGLGTNGHLHQAFLDVLPDEGTTT